MATESGLNDRIGKAYHAFMGDGTVAAVGREAIKDVRSVLMEFFFGKGERGSEPGTPLNPLFYDIVSARNSHTGQAQMNATQPTPSQVIANPQAYLPQQQQRGNGNAMAMEAALDRGKDAASATGAVPTPSQVIDHPKNYLNEQQQQQGHEQQHGRDM